jgi:hypothetical protein
MSTALTLAGYHASSILAAQPGDNTGGEGPDFGKASPVALLLLLVLLIAVGFLVRSMTKHLKKVPASFDKQAAEAGGDAPESSQDGGAKRSQGNDSDVDGAPDEHPEDSRPADSAATEHEKQDH